jgi:HlyD family secretion protein
MNRIRVTAIAAVLLAGAGGLLVYHRADAKEQPAYRLAAAERGDLQSTVSATGTLGAVTTVQVGTQVSGQIAAIYADFNDRVKKGQLLARIDPTLAQQSVQDAEAGVQRAQAQLTQAQEEYDRNKQLYDQRVITASDFGTTEANYAVAKANLKSAQIALEKARKNLSYTSIYAPIDGVIVERNVDVGQTVAASLSAPQLFLIANDLSQMQILASVDESDIGLIHDGQSVQFSVQTYPNQSFTGTVKQVRLQSTTQDNVVNYTVVVEVANPDGKLLPGMTATVQFLVGEAKDALLVPNAALRFRPTADMLASAGTASQRSTAGHDSTALRTRPARTASTTSTSSVTSAGTGTVWYIDANGQPKLARVHVGLSDGQMTAIETTALTPGTQVIVGAASPTQSTTTATTNPLQPQGRGPRPGGF